MIIGTILLGAIAAGVGYVHWSLAIVPLAVLVWLIAFFRDPDRAISTDPHVYVSPADGMVSDIGDLPTHPLLNEPCVRVGIFLSVFNVHVNRSPCRGVVKEIVYKKGKFINAMNHNQASDENESNTILMVDPNGRPVAVVKQIVGLIARRIICEPVVGTQLERGQRIGLIKFGSRTELYIPKSLNPTVKVAVGQKVRGAADIIAVVNP